jgi:ABC-2 type transport system ATP-binding protein
VILSTHILPEVSVVCEGVIIINRGRIAAQGSLDRLAEEFFPTTRIELQISGPAEAVGPALRQIPGILRVEHQGTANGAGIYLVEAMRDRDVRAPIAQLVAERRWGLLELHQAGMSLEEVFLRVVAGEEYGAGA